MWFIFSYASKFSCAHVTILQGVELSIFLLMLELALQQCSATGKWKIRPPVKW